MCQYQNALMIASCAFALLAIKPIRLEMMDVLDLTLNQEELNLNPELTLQLDLRKVKPKKSVKVSYPLFVKRSKSNIFKRAIREDFKKKIIGGLKNSQEIPAEV